jgi:circadian clock protein KaiC
MPKETDTPPKRARNLPPSRTKRPLPELAKRATGIAGLDQVLSGGLPAGRTSLIVGGAGCGKTLLATEFLCYGAAELAEPGVLVTFQEPPDDLVVNGASIGFDLARLQASGMLAIEYVPIDGRDVVEAGEYGLEGLFIRIGAAVAAVGARRIVLDTFEALFSALAETTVVRSELIRLFGWFREHDLTAVVTAEKGDDGRLTRHGIEEYVSDCVILLDHRVEEERSTRRIRVLKYRGTAHSADEHPFIVTDHGIAVLPVTTRGFERSASTDRVSIGVPALDELLTGGVYRGTAVLVSGGSGSGKSTFAASFADAACRRGERTLYISYEESASQIERNMASVGLDLGAWVASGLLRFETANPALQGAEHHLATVQALLAEFEPTAVVVDPLTSLLRTGTPSQVASVLLRAIDMLKSAGVTAMFTSLVDPSRTEENEVQVSSLVDTWLRTETIVTAGERNLVLSIVKSRGMAHSNQLIEVKIGGGGIELLQPYVGPGGVLLGSARVVQELLDVAHAEHADEELLARSRTLEHRRSTLAARIGMLESELALDIEEFERFRDLQQRSETAASLQRAYLRDHRWASHDPDDDPERSL